MKGLAVVSNHYNISRKANIEAEVAKTQCGENYDIETGVCSFNQANFSSTTSRILKGSRCIKDVNSYIYIYLKTKKF
jgi:hypothetical protein